MPNNLTIIPNLRMRLVLRPGASKTHKSKILRTKLTQQHSPRNSDRPTIHPDPKRQ